MEWISTDDRYPENNQKVKIKMWDDINDSEVEVSSIFFDYGEVKGWGITDKEHAGKKLISKPSHWIPLPEKPKENNE